MPDGANHVAFAYSKDGRDRFMTVYPNLNLLDGTDFKNYTPKTEKYLTIVKKMEELIINPTSARHTVIQNQTVGQTLFHGDLIKNILSHQQLILLVFM